MTVTLLPKVALKASISLSSLTLSLSQSDLFLPTHFVCLFYFSTSLIQSQIRDVVFVFSVFESFFLFLFLLLPLQTYLFTHSVRSFSTNLFCTSFHFFTSLIHSQIRDDVGICMLSLCVFLFYYIFFSILLYPTVMHDFCSPWIQKSEFRTMWWTIGFNWVGTFQQKMVFLSHTKSKHFKLLRSKEIWNILCNSCLVVSHFLNGPSMPLFP